ncbi:uncharacterized protein LOC131844614 [Achroia grisella]|uniref:uncharacterized protein LOC131844614 n=1 Tax=Achroia grisella TaxID=688607 RepID=UPI0027D1FE83|nr:uncharacterized protein LOC131844614 [Achroia grisella]XP_059049538.1 uncharacterized protein LOC131844614 [Achroia grisella]
MDGPFGPYSGNDGYGWDEGPDMMDNNFEPGNFGPGRGFNNGGGNFRNNRHNYRNAYGNYRGGYGPGGGYGPPPLFGPGPNFGPGPGMGPNPQFMWGRGFGPRGPPIRKFNVEDKTYRFLIRMGVPKDVLKNTPRDILHLMEPEYCGICTTKLESISVSRMHYISKNHLRNQKKWHKEQPDAYHRKEVPLKSRDLYCEICDVHITSKTHAESHYAGKPHRAIVDGRKLPKNAFLLQKGMEGRLEMLIRREKKFIKHEDVEAQQLQAVQETKNIQPDLFCDICKTSVTCTEQMTMHLNGKRHLAKEKQHILKMMKGGTHGESVGEEDIEDLTKTSANYEEGAEQEESSENQQDSYDWGNGSGNWDEPAATTTN